MAAHLIRRGAPLLAAAALLSACSTSGGSDASSTTAAADRTTTTERTVTAPPDTAPKGEDYGEEDCPSTQAVGKVLGVAVERSMSFGGGLDGDISTTTSGCSYRRAETEATTTTTSGSSFSSEEVSITRISTEAKIAGRLFDLLDEAAAKDAAENGFEAVDGVGEAAYRDGEQLVVHQGSAMVFVKVEPAADGAPADTKTSRALADDVLALKPDPASPPDCTVLKKLVKARLGAITSAISNSSYVGFGDDISITSTGCSVTLADETDVTISVADDAQWDAWVDNKADSPFTASYRSTEVAGRKAFANQDGLVVDDGTKGTGDSPYKVSVEGFGLSASKAAAAQEQIALVAIGA